MLYIGVGDVRCHLGMTRNLSVFDADRVTLFRTARARSGAPGVA